jgi:hypothetical protein
MFSILGLGVAFVPMARADGPSTRPDASGINRQAWRALRGTFRADAYANLIYFSQDEWNDMMGFMQTVSPARANVLARTNLPVESPIRQGLIRRWRAYKFVRDHFPEMAQLQERRFTLEDDLFVLGMKEKDRETNPTSRTSDSADDLREKIHAKVTELLDLGIQEDRLRIEKLNRMLANANNTLAQDQAREPQAVELRTENLMGRFSHSTTRPSGASPHGDAGDGGSNAVSDQTDMSNPASGDADTPATVN